MRLRPPTFRIVISDSVVNTARQSLVSSARAKWVRLIRLRQDRQALRDGVQDAQFDDAQVKARERQINVCVIVVRVKCKAGSSESLRKPNTFTLESLLDTLARPAGKRRAPMLNARADVAP